MGLFDFIADVPIVGDLISAGAEHASAKNLQNDSQAHDSHMFGMQAGHDKDMFSLESGFASAMAAKQFQRQRQMLRAAPRLQVQGLKAAGLNPILAATGGFKSPAGGSLPIPSARASSSAKGSGGGSPPGAKLLIGQTNLLNAQAANARANARLADAQAGIQPGLGDKYGAEADLARENVDKARAEAGKARAGERNLDASTEGILMDNVKKANLANVYDDAFGQVLTYFQEIGVGKALALGAMMLGPVAFARFVVKTVGKEHLPKIISLGRRFWRPGAAREFRDTMNKLRGK
jgi:hypothetical protein